MRLDNLSDTIAAISTPLGCAGIGIVRVSGKDALKIADKIFFSKDRVKPSRFKTYTLHYGWIKNRENRIIDEVILSVMRSPKSYTKEDIVEINCHSSIAALKKILDLVLESGARLAHPGEFTKRAFLNGRIDLTQAEGVLDIIKARTDKALTFGVEQLRGGLSKRLETVKERLIRLLSCLEVNIDFPEEEIEGINQRNFIIQLKELIQDLKELIDTGYKGKILREGVSVVICGRPNVGKSSLLNAILRQERSIVTPIAGTTRDTVEETVDIKGIPVKITDTAGLVKPRDPIEKKAVEKTRQHIRMADVVLLVFDSSQRLDNHDYKLIKELKSKPIIALINKMDLKPVIDKQEISRHFKDYIQISALHHKNIDKLEDKVFQMVWDGKLDASVESIAVNARHLALLKQAHKNLKDILVLAQKGLYLEFIAYGLKTALNYLDEIQGVNSSDEILDEIFSKFCIGK